MTAKAHFSDSAPRAQRPSGQELDEIKALIVEHAARTGSPRAAALLEGWDAASPHFWVLRALPPAMPAPVRIIPETEDAGSTSA